MQCIIKNAPCAFRYSNSIFSRKRLDVNKGHPASLKEAAEEILKFVQKRCNNWPMMCFLQSGSETRIYRIFSNNKLGGMYGG